MADGARLISLQYNKSKKNGNKEEKGARSVSVSTLKVESKRAACLLSKS